MPHRLFASCLSFEPRSADHRWRSFLASVAIMCSAGAVYLFSSYSAELAQRLNFNDTQLNNISTFGNVGLWAGVVAGLVLDTYGVYTTCRGGAALAFVGMIVMGLAVDGALGAHPSHWVLAGANMVFCQGQSWAYLAGMKGALRNFDNSERGRIIGTLVLFFAISSGILSQCYKVIFQGALPLEYFFYWMATTIFIVQFVAAEFIRVQAQHRPLMCDVELVRLRWIQGFGAVVALWVLLMSVVHLQVDSHALYVAMWVVLMIVLVFFSQIVTAFQRALPLAGPATAIEETPLESRISIVNASTVSSADENPFAQPLPPPPPNSSSGAPVVAAASAAATADDDQLEEVATPRPQVVTLTPSRRRSEAPSDGFPIATPPLPPLRLEEVDLKTLNWCDTMRTPEFLLLMAYVALVLAYPITLLNNAAQIVASLQDVEVGASWSGTAQATAMQSSVGLIVAGFATFNAAGRMLFGFLADRFSKEYPRPVWLVVAAALLLGSNLLLAVSMSLPALYFCAATAALGLGGVFSISPLATVEVFGLEKYGRLWGVLTAGPCLSTVVFSTLVAGQLADAGKERGAYFTISKRRYCLGTGCYRQTLLITASSVFVATLVAAAFLYQLRRRQWRSS